jgi:hypothetical protein
VVVTGGCFEDLAIFVEVIIVQVSFVLVVGLVAVASNFALVEDVGVESVDGSVDADSR